MKKDIVTVDELMKILEKENLTEIDYECEGFKINLKRPYKSEAKKSIVPKQEPKVAPVAKVDYVELLSQGIGNFYSSSKGESKLRVGAVIKEGDELGFIQAMGIKNPVVSNVSGTVHEVLVEEGSIVDFNKVILVLKK